MITQMIDETRTEKIKRAAALFSHATHAIAFSGAGISTESGIPDFRSPDSGLWTNVDPLEVASIYGFKKNPQAFYDWVRPLTETTLNAQPNPAHDALVDLERIGNLRGIITQNIDALHNRAGSKVVHELHGHMRQATCIHCFEKFEADSIMKQFMVDGKAPTCPTCQGPIKPDVILFGEQLPIRVFNAAQEATRRCDLMIVIGSSLEVAPASDIPVLAKRTGAKLIIVNLEPTPADRLADVVIHDRAAVILPKIVHQLERSS
jgi:NAD-dependent deacetylase